MKTIKALFAILLFMLCGSSSQAQLLKKLEKKVTQAAQKSADKAADKAVDKTVSKPIDKAADKVLDADVKKKPASGANPQQHPDSAIPPQTDEKEGLAATEEPFVLTSGAPPKIGDPCTSKEELARMPGKYFTAEEYPWPAARAEYFKKLTTAQEKTSAKQVLGTIEKLEQQSRADFALAGGTWEAHYSSEGYHYFENRKLADYRFQTAFYEYLCIKNKVDRNDEYSTVLRVFVNSLAINVLQKHLSNAFSDNLSNYAYKDWKNYKSGAEAPKIALMNYLAGKNPDLIAAVNSGTGYWQDVPENEISKDTYDPICRYWLVKKADVPLLVPVSRKEYLESLLEYYEREALYIPKSNNYGFSSAEQRQRYFGDLSAVLTNKKALVNKVLKENSAEWLSKQAVVNPVEDTYLNQKQNLPEYSSDLTFYKFYDNEKEASPLYKYNPDYFSDNVENAAKPQFMTIAFRYVSKPAPLRLIKNFTDNFDQEAWTGLLH
ncbi:hypothetical protein [Olivibacter sitiensis]|uniref:hypothetical protein n=1 Tax=Olivibacter sitiensis TaxID=376470 RepID=UPI000429F109|nr:hypothetical protein [Olivibacter sitiensis]